MKFKREIYTQYNPFGGDRDVDIRCRSQRLVKARKQHKCLLGPLVGSDVHPINRGDFAVCETAIVDGAWDYCYSCIECMDKFLIDNVGLEPNKPLHLTPTRPRPERKLSGRK